MRNRMIGIVVLMALIGAVAWQLRTDDAEASAHTLTAIDPTAVQRIDITMKGLPPQHFERQANAWTGNDQGRPADLAQLAQTPVTEWKPAADFDPAKLGLAPPLAVLTLDGTRIEYGDLAALGRQRYARVGDRIAFIPAQAMPRAPRTQALPTKPM
ncbi:DUF4340 domain-containing protein [Luteibacter aegosomatissinici]|uniref:DUF4340 domain-containing protein n=1 Tax=Luteibacter aegosomatissinici TaxID=2911539 RepID=UPI001FF7B774|nr:DUF4340 domain-containing protein [Luteibacter aegosomatissinici]UPG94865.1 DUF4340 domain-containing protein [Luteibacter aegosomatissinici]